MPAAPRRRCEPWCSRSPTASACASTSWTPITDRPSAGQTQLRIGRLTKPHGLKGAIKVELYTDDPDRRFTPGAVFQLQVPTSSSWHGKTIELAELRWYNTNAVAFFKGVPDRTVAESLIKAILWVNQDAAELPEEEDAWYDHQLVGLAVERAGVRVGTIARVDHLPAQDLLAVRTVDGEVLVPFVKAIVTRVDVTAGVITVDPPVGLFEEPPEEDLPEPSAADLAQASGVLDDLDADTEPVSSEPDTSDAALAESSSAETALEGAGGLSSSATDAELVAALTKDDGAGDVETSSVTDPEQPA